MLKLIRRLRDIKEIQLILEEERNQLLEDILKELKKLNRKKK